MNRKERRKWDWLGHLPSRTPPGCSLSSLLSQSDWVGLKKEWTCLAQPLPLLCFLESTNPTEHIFSLLPESQASRLHSLPDRPTQVYSVQGLLASPIVSSQSKPLSQADYHLPNSWLQSWVGKNEVELPGFSKILIRTTIRKRELEVDIHWQSCLHSLSPSLSSFPRGPTLIRFLSPPQVILTLLDEGSVLGPLT